MNRYADVEIEDNDDNDYDSCELQEYHVKWEIEVDATSPENAALEALRIQRDQRSIATVFDVMTQHGTTIHIDTNDLHQRITCPLCSTTNIIKTSTDDAGTTFCCLNCDTTFKCDI